MLRRTCFLSMRDLSSPTGLERPRIARCILITGVLLLDNLPVSRAVRYGLQVMVEIVNSE